MDLALARMAVGEGELLRRLGGVTAAPAEEGEVHILGFGEQSERLHPVGGSLAGDEEDRLHRSASS